MSRFYRPSKTPREMRLRRHRRVRQRVIGTATRPRLNIFRSVQHIYAQVINDERGHTLAASSTLGMAKESKSKTEQAITVGTLVAQRALAAGIHQVVFDRGGYRYHGRVKAVAEAARAAGLQF